MYAPTAPRLHLRRAIIVGTAAIVALATSPASGRGEATKASSKFSGNACTLISGQMLGLASIDTPCRRMKTVDTQGGPYKVIYAADWGSVAGNPETGAPDHALAVTVITPAPGYLSLVQAEYMQQVAAGKEEAIVGSTGGFTVMPYVFEPDKVTASDPIRKGFYGNAAFIKDGYLCTVALYDRSPTEPPTDGVVRTILLTLVGVVEGRV